jgi:hypothetical protein
VKATDINPGDRVELAVVITPGPATPRMKTRKAATVVAVERATITVEVTEPVCTNLDELPEDVSPGYAMANGLLRWTQRPVTRQVRAADIVAVVDPAAPAEASA